MATPPRSRQVLHSVRQDPWTIARATHHDRPFSNADEDAYDRLLELRADEPYAPAIPVHGSKAGGGRGLAGRAGDMTPQHCETCRWWIQSSNHRWGDCNTPLPEWVESHRGDDCTKSYDGQECPCWEERK